MLQQLELVQGEDARYDIPVLVDGATPETAIDDWEFVFRFFASRTDADEAALFTLTSSGGAVTVFNSESRTARIRIAKEEIADLASGKYWWRLTAAHLDDTDVLTRGFATITR